MATHELKPCPKCKTNKHVEAEFGHSPFTPLLLCRFVCKKCGRAGEPALECLKAIENWNHRTAEEEVKYGKE